jgi:hypothetical protein
MRLEAASDDDVVLIVRCEEDIISARSQLRRCLPALRAWVSEQPAPVVGCPLVGVCA